MDLLSACIISTADKAFQPEGWCKGKIPSILGDGANKRAGPSPPAKVDAYDIMISLWHS